MPKLIYYVAISLDGYIARKDGDVDWIVEADDTGYDTFFASVDAIIMGRTSYDIVQSFGDWPYGDKPGYVFSNREITNPPKGIKQVHGPVDKVYSEINKSYQGRIWLMGGAHLASEFRKHHLIDEYMLYIIPIWLGDGIPLFSSPLQQEKLEHVSCRTLSNGIVEIIYKQK